MKLYYGGGESHGKSSEPEEISHILSLCLLRGHSWTKYLSFSFLPIHLNVSSPEYRGMFRVSIGGPFGLILS